jgi:hypothetical protein
VAAIVVMAQLYAISMVWIVILCLKCILEGPVTEVGIQESRFLHLHLRTEIGPIFF